MASNEGLGVADVVARNVRRLRGGRSQDEVARFVRVYGLPWSRSVIASIEAGTRSLDLAEAVLLAAALGVGVGGLLAGDVEEVVRLTGTVTQHLVEFRYALGHDSLSRDLLDAGPAVSGNWGLHLDPPEGDRVGRLAPQHVGGEIPDEVVTAQILAMGQVAERRAAAKLGVTPRVATAAAFGLWGRSLTEERDRRTTERSGDAPAGSRQALRGRVTRELLEELSERIGRG